MVHFGERLKHAMDARKHPGPVSVSELASACRVTYQAVKKWLDTATPKLSADSAMTAAKVVDVDLMWLLTGRGPMRATASTGLERALVTLADELAALDEDKRAGVKVFVGQLMDGCSDTARVRNAIALAEAVISTKQPKAA